MSCRAEAVLAAALFVAVALLAGIVPSQASLGTAPGGTGPAASGASTTIFLYGSATQGWGNATSSITNPGPTLYLYQGENVSLALYASDGLAHNWFIDYNGDTKWENATELGSPDFSSSNVATWFNFTVPTDHLGEFTYRCRYHPTLMTGLVYILSPRRMALYGSATASGSLASGWGFANSTITTPGPTLWILAGDNVTLHLVSADNVAHTWFIAYDNGTGNATGEPQSAQFKATPLDFSFSADRTGFFTYRCSIHPTLMYGMIVVVGVSKASAAPKLPLVPTIMIGTIVGVLILAAIYQVRSVSKARRTK